MPANLERGTLLLGLWSVKQKEHDAAEMKRAVFLLTSVLCACWSWTCHSGLAAENADRITASGTGFFITNSGYFLTNYHVIRGGTKVQIKVNEAVLDCRVINVDTANDVAVLKADGSFQWLPLRGSAAVSLGDDVFTIGFPNPELQGVAPKLTKGTISATSGIGDDPRIFQISIPIQPGNSGGPLMDEGGHTVGIVNASLSAAAMLRTSGQLPQNVNFAVKSAYVLPLVEGVIAQNAAPSAPDNRTKQAIFADVEKAVGLVLVFSRPTSTERVEKSATPAKTERVGNVERNPQPLYGDKSFREFLLRLRTAIHRRDRNTIASMMTVPFGYNIKPRRNGSSQTLSKGEGEVLKYWDENGLWVELDRVFAEGFAMQGNYAVAPPQFAVSPPSYRGYRAAIVRVNGRWKFKYFQKD